MKEAKRQLTSVSYEGFPSIVVQPKKTMKRKAAVMEELEEGEIVEDNIPIAGSTCCGQQLTGQARLCRSVLDQRPCKSRKCKLSHQWSCNVAPTCIAQLFSKCTNNPCAYAHNDFVHQFSDHCKQFGTLGYCDSGASCDKLHVSFQMADVFAQAKIDQAMEMARKAQMSAKLAEAKEKAKKALAKKRPAKLQLGITPIQKPSIETPTGHRRRTFDEMQWSEAVEEVHGGETKGEFADQADFVPFC